VGGGPGTHAAYLAGRGHDVTLIDPMPQHVAAAAARSAAHAETPFRAEEGDVDGCRCRTGASTSCCSWVRSITSSSREDRLTRCARRSGAAPGGLVFAEIITRCAWIMDATAKRWLDDEETWDDFDWNLRTGLTKDPTKVADGAFWAYLHRPTSSPPN
jgi:hypothetical protein